MKWSTLTEVNSTLPFLASTPTLSAADLHVAPTGKDDQPGTREAPLATLAAARDAAREFAGKETVTIHVADGTYYLPETLVFTSEDSGSEDHPIVYQAENEGKAVISGGLRLDLKWRPYRDGIWKAATPAGLAIDQVFIDGIRQHMARFPNFDPGKPTAAYQGHAADAFSRERATKWKDPAGGYIHAMHLNRWGGYHYRITDKDEDGDVTYEGGWQNNRQMGMHPEQRMVENIFEELDAPGEWFHNANANTLYYYPNAGEDPGRSKVEVVRLPHLIEFQGSQENPVRHITLKGFTFRHTARTFMNTKEPLLRSDWTIYRGGAIKLTGTEEVSILDSEFDQPGGNAVFFNHYHRRGTVKGCHIHGAGASGVCFVGDPKAVRDPLFEYSQRQPLEKVDPEGGPKTDNYPADCVVEDTLIHGIGRVERQPAGVQISMASRITVRDCSIYDCARSGINVSDGTWGGHLIEGCDVFDTVLETHDHGSFNSWGRDRFWASDPKLTERAVTAKPDLPFLDAYQTTIIRSSRWRCDHGWDVDLDDGSSNYQIYNNLMLQGGLKLREGYSRKAWNNVMVNNGLHAHVWYPNSDNVFTGNIVMRGHSMIRLVSDWAKGVDGNFFTTVGGLEGMQQAGSDKHSLAGDPKFRDPANGDFRVADDSPALQVGFENFPMDQFGVQKPSLKAIANTPEFPKPMIREEVQSPKGNGTARAPSLFWLDARLHQLEGDEFSAFGVAKDTCGVQLAEFVPHAPAAAAGLKTNDLIIELNGDKTPDLPALFAALAKAGEKPIELTVIRDQKPERLRLSSPVVHLVESAERGDAFLTLKVPDPAKLQVSSDPRTHNEPLATLTDGKLAQNYDPLFANGVCGGIYKLYLGDSKHVTAVNTWSSSYGGRAAQRLTLYGSNHPIGPGWTLADGSRFTPIGSIDTTALPLRAFTATSLRAPRGGSLGTYRWILWHVSPISDLAENTSFQAFSVETQ